MILYLIAELSGICATLSAIAAFMFFICGQPLRGLAFVVNALIWSFSWIAIPTLARQWS